MSEEKQTLHKAINEYYRSINLSAQQLDGLQQTSRIYPFNFVVASMVASCLLVIAFGVFTAFKQPGSFSISQEIAYNHNSQMPMEVVSHSLVDIQKYLHRLGFKLVDSHRLPSGGWQLLGGRYCSIDGKIAAQLKIKNLTSGKVYTYYQANLDSALGKPQVFSVDGVDVELWQEKGLVLGLAY